jgi:hypothetical protein
MAESIFCKNCGASLTTEQSEMPCPRCGSSERNYAIQVPAGDSVIIGESPTVSVVWYPDALLTAAQELVQTGQYSIAMVVAHMACEISVEQVISGAFTARGIEYLEDSVTNLLPSYNVSNDRVRSLYNAVTGDQIEKQSFWQNFKESAKRRNEAVHKGRRISKDEAEASLTAATELVTHLKPGP